MSYERCFSDLEAAVGDVQAYFQQRIEALETSAAPDAGEAPSDNEAPGADSPADTDGPADALCRLQLAAHEWMANLVRHARFDGRAPEVHVRIWRQGAQFRCTIEDNSVGFDLESQLKLQRQVTEETPSLPDGGIGLLLLRASIEHVEYVSTNEQTNRLDLAVTAQGPTGEARNGEARNGEARDGASHADKSHTAEDRPAEDRMDEGRPDGGHATNGRVAKKTREP